MSDDVEVVTQSEEDDSNEDPTFGETPKMSKKSGTKRMHPSVSGSSGGEKRQRVDGSEDIFKQNLLLQRENYNLQNEVLSLELKKQEILLKTAEKKDQLVDLDLKAAEKRIQLLDIELELKRKESDL